MQTNWRHTFIGAALGIILPVIHSVATPPPGGFAPIAPPSGGFGIDGDLLANTPFVDVGDWTVNANIAPGNGLSVLGPTGVPLDPIRTFHFTDAYNDTADNIFSGGEKWTDNPNTWTWTTGKASSKTDINNVLLHVSSDTNGHVWAVIAADRLSTSGDSYIDFEFLQSPLTKNSNGSFTSGGPNGGRSTNDILLSIGFTGGGKVADFFAWRWQASGGGFAYADVTGALPAGRVFVALNSNTVATPYSAFGEMGYVPNAFVEAAIDLTALLGNFDPCVSVGFKTIMVKTKASSSSSASIEDFIQPIQYSLNIGPGANAGPDQALCSESAETAFTLQGAASSGLQAVGSITWTVVSGSATVDDPTSPVTTARVSSASATLRLTVTQINGCVKTDDVVLSVQRPPVCSITGVTNACPRSTNTFSAPTGMNFYLWTVVGDGSISGPANQPTVKVVAGAVCGANYTLSLAMTTNVCTTSCSTDVTVVDTGAPVLTTPADLVLDCPAVTTTNVTGAATATDACSHATVTYNDFETIGCGPTKVITRMWTATDECGNSVSRVQTITVRDMNPPVINCPANRTLEFPADTNPANTGVATATDACGSATVTFSDQVTTNCGNTFVISRTWTATDQCNNSSSCTQTITVRDTAAPVITCPANVTLECPADTTTNATGVATATDASGSFTITYADSITANCGNTYVISRQWMATDQCNNSSSCTQTITVRDTTAPVITCPADLTLEYPSATTTNATGAASASDSCSSATITFVDSVTNGCGGSKTIARRWTATDLCGNSSSCTQTITVRDTTAPVITCPPSVTLECPAVTTTNATGVATATDAGGPVTIIYADTITAGCGNTYAITRRWTATDPCNNSSSCTQVITIRDITAPVITCPPNVTLECPADTATNSTGVATATDGCGSVTITFSDSIASNCGNTRTISRTWRATDQCGNSSTCVQTITVRDTSPPLLAYPPNITVECSASTAPSATGNATAQDACNTTTVSYSDIVSNACGDTKVIFRRWTATDSCGNSTNGVQTITVRDSTPPALTLPTNRVLDCPGDTRTNVTGVATAVDVCGSVTISYSDVVSNSCGISRTVNRLWTATDQCGNSTNGLQTIIVRDNTPPTITCPTIKVQCAGDVPPAYANLAAFLAAGGKATDGCDPELTFSLVSESGLVGSCPGKVTRVYRVVDDCGNVADGIQTITVDDTIAPTLTCPGSMTVECGVSLNPSNLGSATATDNCATNVIITHNDSALPSNYSVKWFAADPDSGTGPYLPTYFKLAPGSLPCPNSAQLAGRAIDPLRNAVAYSSPGGQLDALTSMGAAPMALGQIVPFEAVIEVSGGPGPERGTIEFTSSWSTHTTSNDRFGYDTNYMVYCAFVDAADPGTLDPNYNARVESFSSVLVNKGTIDEKIQGTFRVSGLDSGDRVIVEIWVVLVSTQPSQVGGTIASDLVSAQKATVPPQPISTGAQTVSIGNLSKISPTLPQPQPQPPQPPLPPQPPTLPGATVSVIDRTWTATDDCGNRGTCVQRITVRDTTPPVLIAPADRVLEYPPDITTNNTGTATAQDGCGSVAVAYSDIVSNSCGGTKTIWRTWTATDQSGNSTNAVQVLTVRDTIAPAISCPPSVTVEFGADVSTNSLGVATASDFSGVTTITFSDTITTNCGNACTISRLWTAADACGNSANCTQTITVRDTTPPTLSVGANKTINAGDALVFDMPVATDNCSMATVSVLSTTTNYPNPELYAVTRTWKATDACGNVSPDQSQMITVMPPLLSRLELIKVTATSILLRWPTNATEYRLEWSTDLERWSPVAITPLVTNGECRVYMTPTGPSKFFRLVNTPPALEALKMSGGKVLHLTWPTAPSGFQLEASETMAQGSWVPLPVTPGVSNALNHVDVLCIGPKLFFRLKK